MPTAKVGSVEICYELSGDGADLLLLINGLGTQLIYWQEEFLQMLRSGGLRLVAPDNRDSGLSTHLDDSAVPDLMALYIGAPAEVPYTLVEMADDMAGLLGEVGAGRAHVVGLSLGAMIAQVLAIRHPELVASLCSIMSTTGNRALGEPHPEAVALLLRPTPTTREEVIAGDVEWHEVLGSPGYPVSSEQIRARAEASFDRSYDPAGTARQLAAILASPDRTAALGSITVPTLVIHGAQDKLIDPSGGRATAAAIEGARLVEVEGLGHNFPPGVFAMVAGEILANVALARDA